MGDREIKCGHEFIINKAGDGYMGLHSIVPPTFLYL